ncbi:hypothetical protein MRB53_020622 [Persea americana]|uniref:Uncharacterized protein n=1 Tax=Persea americana TaxID=3435 RepID=A0ACC2L1M0_PERAE|nr:hypothetical protein MRB53_020622 [Persea americana]
MSAPSSHGLLLDCLTVTTEEWFSFFKLFSFIGAAMYARGVDLMEVYVDVDFQELLQLYNPDGSAQQQGSRWSAMNSTAMQSPVVAVDKGREEGR